MLSHLAAIAFITLIVAFSLSAIFLNYLRHKALEAGEQRVLSAEGETVPDGLGTAPAHSQKSVDHPVPSDPVPARV